MTTKQIQKLPVVEVAIDLSLALRSELISLTEASEFIPGRHTERINLQMLQRYASRKHGRVIAGRRVILPTTYHAGRYWTTRAAIEAWQRKCDELRAIADDPGFGRTVAQRRRANAKAKRSIENRRRRLARAG